MAGFYANVNVTYDQLVMDEKGTSKVNKKRRKITKNEKLLNKAISYSTSAVLNIPLSVISKVGSYTGNKIQVSNINASFKLGNYAMVATINPYVAIGRAAIDTMRSYSDYTIRQINDRQEIQYKTSLIGKSSTSNSRWRGNYK